MLLKKTDNKDLQIAENQRLLSGATGDRRIRIEQELRILRAGIKGEQEAAYLIDFSRKDSKHTIRNRNIRPVFLLRVESGNICVRGERIPSNVPQPHSKVVDSWRSGRGASV